MYYIFSVFYRGLVSEERGHGKNEIAIRNLGSRFNEYKILPKYRARG